MQPRETGKERSQRIKMDHYRERGGLSKSKVALAFGGAIFGVVAVAYALSDAGSVNTGPLAEAHASLEQNCEACHETMTPIASDSVKTISLLGIDHAKSVQHTFDACTACHQGSDDPIGDHYRAKLDGDWPLVDKNCATCHADHQGRDHDLTAVVDQHCAQCHGQLNQVCKAGSQSVQLAQDNKSITSFSSAHGDFVSLKSDDPGNVTFDHAQHLLPGQPSGGKDAVRLADLEPEARQRYRRKMLELKATDPSMADLDTSDEALVVLDCSSCHELAGVPGGASITSDAELGRYFKPIDFEQHCAACHSMNPAGRSENTLPIPHAATWKEIDQWLMAKAVRTPVSRAESSPLGIGLAGQTGNSTDASAELASEWKTAGLEKAREMVRVQCLKCHEQGLIQDDDSIMAARDLDSPSLIPDRWLKHGIYDHAAHYRVDCRYCHQDAYAEGTPDQPGTDQNRVMIGGIETCVGCHRGAETLTPSELLVGGEPDPVFGGQSLWASDRCTQCHRYHASPMTASDIGAGADPLSGGATE